MNERDNPSTKYYLAPTEGLIGYVYRSAYHACYHTMDKYFTPFLSPKANSKLSFRELNDIPPERNQNMYVVPQALTNQAEGFIQTARELQECEYSEINLNLGCLSSAVVSRHKRAGSLGRPDSLDRFLGEVCGEMDEMGMGVSVKTRLGLISPDEFTRLLEIYNRYPLRELILHPGVRTDYYKNTPNIPTFRGGFDSSRSPVCYNRDVFTISDYEALCGDYPELDGVMLGRRIMSNPGLLGRIVAGRNSGGPGTDKKTLKRFHQMMYEGYHQIVSGDRNILFKMGELWTCMIQIFSDNGRYVRRVEKSQRLEEYETAAAAVFRDLDIPEDAGFRAY